MKRFYAHRSASFSDEKAQEYGEALDKIQERCGGLLTPEEVVHTAKRATSVLHSYFQWDDRRAAHNYRKEQARRLVRLICVREKDNGDTVDVPAFTSIVLQQREEDDVVARAYVSTDHNLQVSEAKGALLEWVGRYDYLPEMAGIVRYARKALRGLEEEQAA